MKTSSHLMTLTTLATLALTGCVRAPFVPPHGAVFSQVQAPLDLDFDKTNLTDVKRGTSEVVNVLGLFTFGDASAKAAAENGQIQTIEHADYEHFNVLGILQKTTVIVYGK